MRRVVNNPAPKHQLAFRGDVPYRMTPCEDLSGPVPCSCGSRNSSSAYCSTELTFGSVVALPSLERSVLETTTSSISTPPNGLPSARNEENLDRAARPGNSLACGHDGLASFNCEICMQRHCKEFCRIRNRCGHFTCRSCSVACIGCAQPVCVGCMIRCAECLHKLCTSKCGTLCARCGEVVCPKCATAKGANAGEQCICAQCVSTIFGYGQNKSADWFVMYTIDLKPAFLTSKDGRSFSLKGKYIGKFSNGACQANTQQGH